MKSHREAWRNRWAVVGFTYDVAKAIMLDIEHNCHKKIVRKVTGICELKIEFDDGTTLRWIPARESSRGFRIGKMWCDKNIDRHILRCVILPCYFGESSDIIWL